MLNGRFDFRFLVPALLLALGFSGCRNGIDQDDQYVLSFRTLFVRSTDSSGVHLTSLDMSGVHIHAETGFGISPGKLGGSDLRDNQLWLGDTESQTISLFQLPGRRVFTRGVGLIPHIIAAGDRYVLVADTSARLFRLFRITDMNAAPYQDTGKVLTAGINGGKLCLGFEGRIEIWDEYALSRQFTIAQPGYAFRQVYLDAARNFQLQAKDTAGLYLTRADIYAGRPYVPMLVDGGTYQRYSCYTFRQYQTELLQEVRVADGELTVGGIVVDSASQGATAFFPGLVWYTRRDSVFLWNGTTSYFVGSDSGTWEGHHEYLDMR